MKPPSMKRSGTGDLPDVLRSEASTAAGLSRSMHTEAQPLVNSGKVRRRSLSFCAGVFRCMWGVCRAGVDLIALNFTHCGGQFQAVSPEARLRGWCLVPTPLRTCLLCFGLSLSAPGPLFAGSHATRRFIVLFSLLLRVYILEWC